MGWKFFSFSGQERVLCLSESFSTSEYLDLDLSDVNTRRDNLFSCLDPDTYLLKTNNLILISGHCSYYDSMGVSP